MSPGVQTPVLQKKQEKNTTGPTHGYSLGLLNSVQVKEVEQIKNTDI
jgi:hypothetical protein